MAGHSKFKNIMHRKGAQDGKRAKIFAKLAREITVASKSGMPDPQQNHRLRNAIINVRHEYMPNERIKKAIQKASSNEDNNDYEEIRYEGIGSNGVSLIIETLTDNRNRTASEIRSILSKNGGNLGETNSVAYNFDHVGKIGFTSEGIDKEKFFDFSVDLGASDVIADTDIIYTICQPEIFGSLRDQLEKKYGEPSVAKLIWQIKNSLVLDEGNAKKVVTIIEQLEENDDVQNVYSNIEVL